MDARPTDQYGKRLETGTFRNNPQTESWAALRRPLDLGIV